MRCLLPILATAVFGVLGCSGAHHAPPVRLGPPVSDATPDAPFVSFHSPALTTAANQSAAALLRTVSGRLALAVIDEQVRGGEVAHAMQALLLPPDVIDAELLGDRLCTLKQQGVVLCASVTRSSEPVRTEIQVGADARRLLLLSENLRCVLREAGAWGCYNGRNGWKLDERVTRELDGFGLAASPVPQSACFLTRDAKLVCMREWEGFASARVELEGATQASVGRGSGDFGGACAVRGDGGVTCWGGMNDTGVLGDGKRGPHDKPSTVPGVKNAVAVARSPDYACALTRERQVWCWGSADAWSFGDTALEKAKTWSVCGDGDSPGKDDCVVRAAFGAQRNHLVMTPMRVPELEGVVSIATGMDRTCGVRTDGRLLCVGGGHAGAFTVDLAKPR